MFPPLYGVDMPPLGIAYIAAKLIEEGYSVKVFCFNSQLHAQRADKRFLWGWDKSGEWDCLESINRHFDVNELAQKWVNEIISFKPNAVGFSVNSHSKILANFLAAKLKKKEQNLFIVFGGPWCTELADTNELDKNVDMYVRGEGEDIIRKAMEKLARNDYIQDLNMEGVIVKTKGGFKDNGRQKSYLDINTMPLPALHLFDFDNYTSKDEIPILFSRGCDYYCKFCVDKPMWGRYRMRAAENIITEMKYHSGKFGRKRFKCNDLMINGDLPGLNDLAGKLIENKLDFEWGSMARARPDMRQEMFHKLKKAGCIYLTYGIESGAAKVLAHMGKPDKKTIAEILKMTHLSKIKVNTLWMVGYPNEGWDDILETMAFLFMNKKYIDELVSVSCCYIPNQSLLGRQRAALRIEYDNTDWRLGRQNNLFIREVRRKLLLYFAKLLWLYKGGIR